MATWLHCDIENGNVCGLSQDKNFQGDKISKQMKTDFFHVKIPDNIDDVKHWSDTIFLGEDVLFKHKGYIDFVKEFPTIQADIANPTVEVEPVAEIKDVSIIKTRV